MNENDEIYGNRWLWRVCSIMAWIYLRKTENLIVGDVSVMFWIQTEYLSNTGYSYGFILLIIIIISNLNHTLKNSDKILLKSLSRNCSFWLTVTWYLQHSQSHCWFFFLLTKGSCWVTADSKKSGYGEHERETRIAFQISVGNLKAKGPLRRQDDS